MTNAYEQAIIRYYSRAESALGYRIVLGGARHVGYFPADAPHWRLRRALRAMEHLVGTSLALPPGARVLDAGCGLGQVAIHLAEQFHHCVTGIDLLKSNVRGARRRASRSREDGHLHFLPMNYHSLEFDDESFHGVYAIESLLHAEDLDAVAREFFRVLVPGGSVALFEFSRRPDGELSTQASAAFAALNAREEMPGFQQLTHGMLSSVLSDAGFVSVAERNLLPEIAPMLRFFALIGQVPRVVGSVLHLDGLRVSSLSAINIWQFREELSYTVVTARKPEQR